MLALRKKIFVYTVISICIITTQWRHYILFIRAVSIITIYDQRNVTPVRNAIRRETNQLDLPTLTMFEATVCGRS